MATRKSVSWIDRPMREWKKQPVIERMLLCAKMLRVHGLITDREYFACKRRTQKLYLRVNRVTGNPQGTNV